MKLIVRILILMLLTNSCSEKLQVKVANLKCENKVAPLGVDIQKPRFSWISESDHRGVFQSAYQIIVASDPQKLHEDSADIWVSQKIFSEKSSQIYYEGKTLESNHKYFWKVKVWDQHGGMHNSDPTFWTTGLFHDSDWKAKWIGLDKAVGNDDPNNPHTVLSARMLRHEFTLEKKIKSATAFISGLGLFELYINYVIVMIELR